LGLTEFGGIDTIREVCRFNPFQRETAMEYKPDYQLTEQLLEVICNNPDKVWHFEENFLNNQTTEYYYDTLEYMSGEGYIETLFVNIPTRNNIENMGFRFRILSNVIFLLRRHMLYNRR
jgi:hypothetical protein